MSDTADDASDSTYAIRSTEGEIKELLGLFDAPAFARRGRDMEWALNRTVDLCKKRRLEMLDMVHCRLRIWANGVTGPQDWPLAFTAPIDHIWPLAEAPAPVWKAKRKPSPKAALKLGQGVSQSIERFNTRWTKFVNELNAAAVNKQIDHYNKYYILEKECIVGSTRLAARLFEPRPRIEPQWLLTQFPLLPVPGLRQL